MCVCVRACVCVASVIELLKYFVPSGLLTGKKACSSYSKGSFWILGLLCQHFGFVLMIFGTINLCVYVYVCMYCRREGAAMARAETVTVCID